MAEVDTVGNDTWDYGNERFITYLPLSHIAGTVRMVIIMV